MKRYLKLIFILAILVPMASCSSCGGSGGGGSPTTVTTYFVGSFPGGDNMRWRFNYPSAGKVTIDDYLVSTTFECDYANTGSADGITYLVNQCTGALSPTMTVIMNGHLLVGLVSSSNSNIFAGIMIDPNNSDLSFARGHSFNGQGMENWPSVLAYMKVAVNADGTAVTDTEGEDITIDGTDVPLGSSSNFVYNSDRNYFSSTASVPGKTLDINLNEQTGFGLMIDEGIGFGLFAQYPGSDDVPSGISAGDVYYGFHFTCTSAADCRGGATVSVAVAVNSVGDPRTMITMTFVSDTVNYSPATTVTATWPGFYKVIDNEKVLYFLGSEGIIETKSNGTEKSYFFGIKGE